MDSAFYSTVSLSLYWGVRTHTNHRVSTPCWPHEHLFQPSTPERNLVDGAGQHPLIPLVYNKASFIGVDTSMRIPLYLIWPDYRNIMC